MEERPSKLQISVSSIKEFDLTEGEIKAVKKESELRRKSATSTALKTTSRDNVPTKEQQSAAPESDVKRTVSLSASKREFKTSKTAVQKSNSSEAAQKTSSLSTVPAAKKRSSSVEQHAKTQSQVKLGDGKKASSAEKVTSRQSVTNQRSNSVEKTKTNSQVKLKESNSKQGIIVKVSESDDRFKNQSQEKVTSSESAVKKRSSSADQNNRNSSKIGLKDTTSKPVIQVNKSSTGNTSKEPSKKSKSAGAESRKENANDTRKQNTSLSAPVGKRQSQGAIGFTNLFPPGTSVLTPSSLAVKPAKSRQGSDRRPSHVHAGASSSGGPQHAASKHSEQADHGHGGTQHSPSAGRQHREVVFVPDVTPFSDTPFPFERSDSINKADSGWLQQALDTPTPWGGMGNEVTAALLATSSGAMLKPRRSFSVTPAPKQQPSLKENRGTSKGAHAKRSLDKHKSITVDEEPQCLSLSMARAVTDEKKRSFFTVLDDETLEKLQERAEELKKEEEVQALAAAEEAASRAQLQERASVSTINAKRTASGRRVSSGTSLSTGGRAKKSGEGSAQSKMSGEDISNIGSSDHQTRLITLENPFKKPKKNKEDEDADIKNIYATALLDKWMAQGKHENKAPAGKNTKQADAKSKKIGFLKQLLQGAKKQPTNAKEKVLHTLTEKKINLLIPQSLPDPRVIDPADQVPVVGVSPIDAVPDSEAGHSQGNDSRRIQEEFFASVDTYRTSIAHARQRVAHRQGQVATSEKTAPAHHAKQAAGTSTDPIEDPEKKPPKTGEGEEGEEVDGVAEDMEVTLADILPDEEAARLEWRGSSSSEVTLVGSDGTVSRRRKSSLRRKKRASSAEKYQKWKRKTSTKAYVEYQRRTDPRFHVDEDQTSHSTSLSLYPVSSTESTAVGGRASWSDISSVQTAPDPAPDGGSPGRVTRSTATEEQGRTEGTQTSSTEYLLLDRQSCLVKVLAALQRLNTDEALQVARILRRSLDEDRVYEDVSVKQILEPKRSSIDASSKPLTRVESEKVVAKGSPSRSGAIPEMISDQDYDELTRIVSQIDLMVRSKLRITAAPYSLIYETLINYHLEITQDYSPSVAVFNYYLTEQGHPLFDDTSGFFRPTILQVPRESLYPRLYAHKPYEEPRELPAGGRLLDLQLLLGELLICPFCGHDVVWGQHEMCVDFCCESFAEVISREYEDDLGRIRRQAALRGRRAAIGELEEDSELLEAALSAAASDQQPPAKISCLVEKRTRLRALGRYGQDGTATGKAPHLLPFDMDMVKKASAAKAGEAKQSKHKSHKSRRKSSGPADAGGRRSATRRRSQRHASEPRKGSRTKRSSRLDGAAAGDESPPTGRRASRNKKRRTTRRDMMHEVEKLERKMGRRLTQDELEAVMEGDSVMQSDARGLSITAGGIEEKLDVTSMENIPDRGPSRRRSPRTSRDYIIDDTIGIRLSSYMKDTDDTTTADTESSAPPARRKGKERGGGPSRRSKKKRERERETEASTVDLESRDSKTKRAERAERDSVSPDDQLHYRLSESAFLEEGVTLLPWDGSDGDGGDPTQPQQQIITHPVELGQRQFLQERYPDGNLFVTWFDDGSGHVMYPNGEPAILITVEPAGRRFVVLPDQPCADLTSPNCVLAMFDPKGIGFVYSNKGAPRLLLDQREGWYHRDDGTVRRWHWSDLDDHIHHSPTLQPVIFAISRHVAIRVIRQDYIVLSFWANQRSARFNVGVTAEAATVTPVPGTAPLSPDQYRLVCQGTDQMELTELKGRVRRILAEMARITDEPVKYLIYHQKLLQRGLNVPLRRPVPQWLTAEPRQPRLPAGVSAALGRRSAAAAAVGNSARRAFLLQKMALLSHSEMTSAERRAGSAASQARSPSLQTLSQPTPLATIVPPPAEVT